MRRGWITSPLGAARRNRTPDLLITNQLLYLLSYGGMLPGHRPGADCFCIYSAILLSL